MQPSPGAHLPAPVRWLLSARETIARLESTFGAQTRLVVVQNPPIFAPLLAWAWARFRGVPIVIDSHPASFGVRQRLWRWFVPLHRWLARRVAAVLVPSDELADVVSRWGGLAVVVHEAPPEELEFGGLADHGPSEAAEAEILVVAVGAADEPVEVALQAAKSTPGTRWAITGRREAYSSLSVPANVVLTGHLAFDVFAERLRAAAVVVSLSTDRTTVSRAAWEATLVGKALVISDWPVAAEAFPNALRVANEPELLASAVQRVLKERAKYEGASREATERLAETWASQRSQILRFAK